jgi:hypothetical protein
MSEQIPPPQDYTGLHNYLKTAVQVEDLFTSTKRLLREQLRRLEKHMFLEENKLWDPTLAKQAKELSAAVTSLGQMFLKIEEKAVAASDAMTTDEKISAVCDMIRTEGRYNQAKFFRQLRELDFELSKNPDAMLGGSNEGTD